MTEPTAVAPWTVTLCWTPEQNGGDVAVHPGRAPLYAVIGQLRAGELYTEVAADHGMTVEQVTVIDWLQNEAKGWPW